MKTSILLTLLHYLMVGLFILTLMHINVVMDAQTVMTGETEVGNRPYILKTPAIQPQQPMKTPKENNDSIKRRRHESPRNNVNSSKPTKQRRKNTWNKFYKSKLWKELRDKKLHDQPICEECIKNDIIKAAATVHHIIPFSKAATDEERWRLFLDYYNLQSLCNECHRRIHRNINITC